jgi:hypothetical protein
VHFPGVHFGGGRASARRAGEGREGTAVGRRGRRREGATATEGAGAWWGKGAAAAR